MTMLQLQDIRSRAFMLANDIRDMLDRAGALATACGDSPDYCDDVLLGMDELYRAQSIMAYIATKADEAMRSRKEVQL